MYCDYHDRPDCTLCDECGHESDQHTSLHDVPDADWTTATCWAEFVCEQCVALTAKRDADRLEVLAAT